MWGMLWCGVGVGLQVCDKSSYLAVVEERYVSVS